MKYLKLIDDLPSFYTTMGYLVGASDPLSPSLPQISVSCLCTLQSHIRYINPYSTSDLKSDPNFVSFSCFSDALQSLDNAHTTYT